MKGLMQICTECNTPTQLGLVIIDFERKGIRATMSGIPAMVCPECGEQYIPGEIASSVAMVISRTIDETVEMYKTIHNLRQQLRLPLKENTPECLELSLA
jgi:YgiT-type zinc finger domain-containing protein